MTLTVLVLDAEVKTAIESYYGTHDLVHWTNTNATSQPAILTASIDFTRVAQWVSKCIAWFSQRGNPVNQESELVINSCALFRPDADLSEGEREEKRALATDLPPVRTALTIGTGIAPGDPDDRREFSDDQLAAIDSITESRNNLRSALRGLE